MRSSGLVLLAALALAACGEVQPAASTGSLAPAFAARRLDGDSVRLTELRDQVVLLNVWATWCIPCRKEMPELQALHTELAEQGLHVVGVSVDEQSADATVRNFTTDLGITYTILRDPAESVSFLFQIPGVPATFLIDREGRIAWRHIGPFDRDNPALRAALAEALSS